MSKINYFEFFLLDHNEVERVPNLFPIPHLQFATLNVTIIQSPCTLTQTLKYLQNIEIVTNTLIMVLIFEDPLAFIIPFSIIL